MRTHYKTLIENDYLGQWDLVDGSGAYREVIVEISSVRRYKPKRLMKGEVCKRLEIAFRGKRKAWLSGPSTQRVIASMLGPYTEDWVGKRIALYVDEGVMFGGVRVGGIRVRPSIPRGAVTTSPLDMPVDSDTAARIDNALERQPGDD